MLIFLLKPHFIYLILYLFIISVVVYAKVPQFLFTPIVTKEAVPMFMLGTSELRLSITNNNRRTPRAQFTYIKIYYRVHKRFFILIA